MHVAILGAGGLGCVVGGWLAESGTTVSLVARSAHVDAINARGLHITGIRGERTVRDNLRAVTDPAQITDAIDYCVLLTKTRDTDAILESAAPLRDRVAVALSLQNSVAKDDRLVQWIGADRVVGATTIEAGTLTGPGEVRNTATAPTSFYFGELDGSQSSRVDQLAGVFSTAGLRSAATPLIQQAEWEKLLQISIVAGFSASTLGFRPDTHFAHGIATRSGAEHYVAIARELLAVYQAMDYEPQDFFAPFSQFRALADASFEQAVANALELGTTMVANGMLGRPSLHEDILRRKPTEVEDGLGRYLDAADQLGISAPTAWGAYRVIKTLEALETLT